MRTRLRLHPLGLQKANGWEERDWCAHKEGIGDQLDGRTWASQKVPRVLKEDHRRSVTAVTS